MSALATLYVALTLATFALYGLDKRQARRAGRRLPARTPHVLALAGGFLGAWLGRRVFRHKTQKPAFGLFILLAATLHLGALAWVRLR